MIQDRALSILPVRFRPDLTKRGRNDPERGTTRTKHSKAYYLDGLPAVFHPGVSLPSALKVEQRFASADVVLLNPGPNAVEVMGIVNRFPDIKCLHIIESCEKNIDAIRSEVLKEVGRRSLWLPEMAGYVTDVLHLPEELANRCDLVVEINVFDPKADKMFRQAAVRQISRLLKPGGLFYSAGVTIRWTDRIFPLGLDPVPLGAKILNRTLKNGPF